MVALKRSVAIVMLNLTAIATIGWAGCKTDCKDEYESKVESCKAQYDDPDDSDMLNQCIQSAKDDYDACIEECDS